jgi:hypothetical protein
MLDTQMEVILARRFAPFNFHDVPCFPNVVPTMDEWRDCLPIFRESKDDHPVEHLLSFMNLCTIWISLMRMYS